MQPLSTFEIVYDLLFCDICVPHVSICALPSGSAGFLSSNSMGSVVYLCEFCHEDLSKKCIYLRLFSGTLQGYQASPHPSQRLSKCQQYFPIIAKASLLPRMIRSDPILQPILRLRMCVRSLRTSMRRLFGSAVLVLLVHGKHVYISFQRLFVQRWLTRRIHTGRRMPGQMHALHVS